MNLLAQCAAQAVYGCNRLPQRCASSSVYLPVLSCSVLLNTRHRKEDVDGSNTVEVLTKSHSNSNALLVFRSMDSSEMRFRSNSSSEITVLKYIIDCKRVKTKLFSACCQTNEHKENYCLGIYGPAPCTAAISFSRVPPHLLYVIDISMSSAFYSDVASTCLCQSP